MTAGEGQMNGLHVDREGLAERRDNGRIQCLACQRGCVLGSGQLGFCRVRQNRDGRLVPLSYGRVAALHHAAVERKPLYHFYPGRELLSAGSLGCNFRCPGCQNRGLSFAAVPHALAGVPCLSPEELVRRATEDGLAGISWTYNEPATWFEYALDGAGLARKAPATVPGAEGLLTNLVTNGSLTRRALDEIGPFLDAYRVDIKGFSEQTYSRVANFPDFRGILDVAERARHKWGMHLECVTNVIPTLNDSEDELRSIARWIHSSLGADVPWHVTAFRPCGDLAHLERTPVSCVERARDIGMGEGLQFVYLGNVPGHPSENTHCPGCGRMLIERSPFRPTRCRLEGGTCPDCGYRIPGRFE